MVEGKLYFNIFSEVRPEEHARIKKPIAKYFSATGVAPLEPHVDAVLATLCGVIDQRFAGDEAFGPSFDFAEWMQFCKTMFRRYYSNWADFLRRVRCGRQDYMEPTGRISRERV